MATLYEIEEIFKGLLEYAEENDGDITEVVDEFEKVRADFETKAENYWRMIKNFTAEAEALKAERDRLYKKQVRAEKIADSLRQRIGYAMDTFERDKVKTKYGSFSFRKSTKVQILDDSAIPDEFCKIERTPKLSVIGKAIKDGETVPGAVVVDSKSLQVR